MDFLPGVVKNVVAFGAFVDVRVGHDGLLHVPRTWKIPTKSHVWTWGVPHAISKGWSEKTCAWHRSAGISPSTATVESSGVGIYLQIFQIFWNLPKFMEWNWAAFPRHRPENGGLDKRIREWSGFVSPANDLQRKGRPRLRIVHITKRLRWSIFNLNLV